MILFSGEESLISAYRCGLEVDRQNARYYLVAIPEGELAAREWTEEEFEDACRRLSQEQLSLSGTAHRLELWEPLFPPLKVVAVFNSREPGERIQQDTGETEKQALGRPGEPRIRN